MKMGPTFVLSVVSDFLFLSVSLTEELNEVWKFVEAKIHCAVPEYFKHILKACGYDNLISIATIEEEDVEYFEQEVRNGKVSKYYKENRTINIWDGSTKTEAEFEFTRGHKKLLLFIASYIKRFLEKPNSSAMPLHSAAERSLSFSNRLPQTLDNKFPSSNQNNIDSDRNVKLQQGILTCEVIMSLINATPALFVANIELIKNKLNAHELFKIKALPNQSFEAVIYCPICSKPSNGMHNELKLMWNVSDFVDHLNIAHKDYKEQTDSKAILRQHHGQVKGPSKCGSKCLIEHLNDSANTDTTSVSDEGTLQETLQFSHTVGDDVEDLSYSNILKEGMALPKVVDEPGRDGMGQPISGPISPKILPQLGNYVVCSLFVKDTVKWPSTTNIKKNFVGKICEMKENGPNVEGEEMFNIQFLTKTRHSNFIFVYPDQVKITCISKSKIVKILPDPVQNRRGGLVFKDKSMSDYIF